jgi:hypothetical protein
MRDTVVGIDAFLHEAVAALGVVLLDGSALRCLVFLTLQIMFKNEGGNAPRQSDLDQLQRLFSEAVDEAAS